MVKKQFQLYGCGFIVYIKIDDIYKDIAEDVETRFDTSNYELDRSLTKKKKCVTTRKLKFEIIETLQKKLKLMIK